MFTPGESSPCCSGYYVSNEYDCEELNANPPETVLYDRIQRNILADKPRVTRYDAPDFRYRPKSFDINGFHFLRRCPGIRLIGRTSSTCSSFIPEAFKACEKVTAASDELCLMPCLRRGTRYMGYMDIDTWTWTCKYPRQRVKLR